MITEYDLYKLGYRISMRLTDKDHTIDFIHAEKNREYLVNLDRGEINIVYPNSLPPQKIFVTKNLDEFETWHKNYKQ